MSRILVTGAGGYIGTSLVPLLLEHDHDVVAVDRYFFGDDLLPDHPRLTVVQEDSRHLPENLLEGVTAVVDLVAVSNDPSGELFQEATWQINWQSRVRTAKLAKTAGVKRYILPSSCSIYGFLDADTVATENTPPNPLTTYARANQCAERDILPLAGDGFTVVVLRQATLYGLSPRMRFDLAINGMTYGAWSTGRLPLMRDGTQWRPMLHVKDAALAQLFMLDAPAELINGQIFNVGADANCYQIGPLGQLVADLVPRDVDIEWYGDPDRRSYRVAFNKIEKLGFRATRTAATGVSEICAALEAGAIDRTTQTITLEWYRELKKWHDIIKKIELYGGILDIKDEASAEASIVNTRLQPPPSAISLRKLSR